MTGVAVVFFQVSTQLPTQKSNNSAAAAAWRATKWWRRQPRVARLVPVPQKLRAVLSMASGLIRRCRIPCHL